MKMTNKRITYLAFIYLLTISMGLVSCEDKLDEDFNNPEKTTITKIEYHFTQNLLKGNFRLDANDAWNFAFNSANAYSDINVRNSNNGVDEISDPTRANGLWKNYYTVRMAPITEMNLLYNKLSGQEKDDYRVYIELGKICGAFKTHHMTDIFGDMPYSDAFKARAIGDDQELFPKYDTQEEIYDAMLKDLKDASDALKAITLNDSQAHRLLPTQDLIFHGDLGKWEKFANSLRLRLAMRISNIDPNKAKSVIEDIINNYSLIETNSDNVVFESEGPDGLNGLGEGFQLSNRGYEDAYNFGNTFASETMMNVMNPANDPRLLVLFQPNNNGDYVGVPNAPDLQADWVLANGPINEDNVAIINRTTFENNELVPGVSMTAAEVAFLKSEAILKGFISGNAQDEYEKGIRLSIEFYYGIRNLNTAASIPEPDAGTINTFLSTAPVAFDNTLEQVYTQKWIHLGTLFPFESWAEYRRTGVPGLPDYLANGSTVARPVRFLYPSDEAAFNSENYSTVSGKDTFYDNVWWDKD